MAMKICKDERVIVTIEGFPHDLEIWSGGLDAQTVFMQFSTGTTFSFDSEGDVRIYRGKP